MTTYDVFLSYATDDKSEVETLARRLREDGLEPFLDKWHLVPGEPWQAALEDALGSSRACAVFVGGKLGPWQNVEMRNALDEGVRNQDFRAIPVLLPGAFKPGRKGLPRFLRRLTWVEFCCGLDGEEAYHRLLCGIRGIVPDAAGTVLEDAFSYRAKLPPHDFFVYLREFDKVRDLLTRAAGSTVGITTALRGAGGFGKTALARALCDDPEVLASRIPYSRIETLEKAPRRESEQLSSIRRESIETAPEHRPDDEAPVWYFAMYRLVTCRPTKVPEPADSNPTPLVRTPHRVN